jgi:hypothetical protein
MKSFRSYIAVAEEDSLADIANKKIRDKKAIAAASKADDKELNQPKDKEDKEDGI